MTNSKSVAVSTHTSYGHQQFRHSAGIGHTGPVSCVTENGGLIATAGYDSRVVLTDAVSGRAIDRIQIDHLANHVDVSANGRRFLVGGSDYTGRMYEYDGTHARLVTLMNGHDDDIERMVFSPTGERVATASRDHKVRIFDLHGRLLNVLCGHGADVIGLAFPTERRLLSTSDDGSVCVWDAITGQLVQRVDTGVETDAVAVSNAGVGYVGTDDGEIIVAVGGVGKCDAHRSGIKALVIRAGQMLSTSYDGTVGLWSIDRGKPELLRRFQIPSIVWARSVAFIGEHRAAFGTFGSRHAILDLITGQWSLDGVEPYASLNAVKPFKGKIWAVGDSGLVHVDGQPLVQLSSLANFLLPVGNRILAGGQSGEVFDAESGQVLGRASWPLNCGAALPDGRCVIGGYGGSALVIADGKIESEVKLHANAIKGLAASETHLFSVAADGRVAQRKLSDLHSPPVFEGAHDRIANGCAALKDGRFASISRDLTLRLWHGERVEVVKSPHRHSIKCLATSTAGRFVATGGYRGSIAIYDLATAQWLDSIRVSAWGVSSLTALPSGEAFLASTYDGSVHRIDMQEGVHHG